MYHDKLVRNLNTLKQNDILVCDFRYDEGIRVRENKYCPTLNTKNSISNLSTVPLIIFKEDNMGKVIRIRKLTPIEYYRLMGFEQEDCKKCSEAGISKTQLYKQAGNSIVVNVLQAIFSELGKTYEEFSTRVS